MNNLLIKKKRTTGQWKKTEKKEKKKSNLNTFEHIIKKERKKRIFYGKYTAHRLNKRKTEDLYCILIHACQDSQPRNE